MHANWSLVLKNSLMIQKILGMSVHEVRNISFYVGVGDEGQLYAYISVNISSLLNEPLLVILDPVSAMANAELRLEQTIARNPDMTKSQAWSYAVRRWWLEEAHAIIQNNV